jgi:hypothetical protein
LERSALLTRGVPFQGNRQFSRIINKQDELNRIAAGNVGPREYPLDLVAHEGNLLADNQQRVADQKKAYG